MLIFFLIAGEIITVSGWVLCFTQQLSLFIGILVALVGLGVYAYATRPTMKRFSQCFRVFIGAPAFGYALYQIPSFLGSHFAEMISIVGFFATGIVVLGSAIFTACDTLPEDQILYPQQQIRI